MAKIQKSSRDQIFRQPRGWGYELWLYNGAYCGKILHLEKGKRGSLHFHRNKDETMYLGYGRVDLLCIDPADGKEYTVELFGGDTITIDAPQVHQIIALEESEIIEFSTYHQEEDSYRVKKGD